VDLQAASAAVALIRDIAASASRPEVVKGVGGFAGLFDLGDRRLLAAAADGVGTKLELARLAGKLDTVGIDLVAMCANDVVCTGAAPLFFLDYLAVGRVVPDEVAAIVAGVAEGCRRARCALLGGETAEHPGVLTEGQFDLAGFCVGLVEEDELLDPSKVRPGDLLIGFRSSGLHSNGYSLVRRALIEDPVLALCREGLALSAAHITGGGFHENVPRALPAGLGAVIDTRAWEPQQIFGLVAEASGVDQADLFGVLNMGIGMVVVVPRARVENAISVSKGRVDAVVIGEVVAEPGLNLVSQRD
jgi:phosphoribosylformylglycinamidine cyclo-ligase